MKILVINSGSSSLKFQLFDMADGRVLAKGLVERIGEAAGARAKYSGPRGEAVESIPAPDHNAALAYMAHRLADPAQGAVKSLDEVDAVGHRVVHGGEKFVHAALIDDAVVAAVDALAPLAPLHNPPNLAGIRAARRYFPAAPHVAVFDTAFHQTMPRHAYLYPLPYDLYEKHGVRRYGFHGTSHLYVARLAAERIGKDFDAFNAVTCHLGNGCSIAAIKQGKSVDTSMGLTPLEGLMMGTRSGDIDPALPFYLHRATGLPFEKVESVLNKQSGLLGVSGLSNDCRTLWEAADKGHDRARLALEIFAYRVRKYIGAYMAVLNGLDAVVFTGGIGERDILIRQMACSGLDWFGIHLDEKRNLDTFGKEGVISTPESRVRLMVIPTNEELEIANETLPFARKARPST